MASQREQVRGEVTCAVDVPPVVDAGTGMTLRARVSCDPARDLRGHTLLITDRSGAEIASVALTGFDGRTNDTGEFMVTAPIEAGECTWLAVCPPFEKEGVAYMEGSAPIAFAVQIHATNAVAWDIPPAIEVGERFRMKIGFKCANDCPLAGGAFAIHDHEGAQVAAGTLPAEPWPGTTGLYAAEVELPAPATEGLYTWTARGPGSEAGLPHAESSVGFGVRVVARPEFLVTVETVDAESQAPLGGARVVMHPYKAVADERGVARVRVAKGAYRLFVSQTRYVTLGLPVEVTADLTTRAELYLEPVSERN